MKIKVNGEERNLELENENALLSNTIELLGYNPKTVIVEVNSLIINSTRWENKILKDGDRLEIVSIVGGG